MHALVVAWFGVIIIVANYYTKESIIMANYMELVNIGIKTANYGSLDYLSVMVFSLRF